MSKLTKKERLLHSLIGIKQLFNDLGAENLKNEIVLKDGTTETIDCYKEIEEFVVDFINNEVDEATPKKPFYEANGYDENGELIYDTWICPNCNHYYEVDYDDYDYCPNCGQPIDWIDK